MDDSFEGRLEEIRSRIARASASAGRAPGDVTLLPVTKKHGPDVINEAAACGLAVFGENRVQEAKQKIPLCSSHLEWHMIGHLQRNKVRDAVGLFSMIHSVDSLRLLQAINEAAGQAGVTMPVMIEVNLSGEGAKYGVADGDVEGLVVAGGSMMSVDIVGLMTMPPFVDDPDDARPYFSRLRGIRDKLKETAGVELRELSMGMSNDFEVAIEEGATLVRVGSALFGARA